MGVMTRRLGPRDMDPDEDGGTATSKIKRIIHKNLIFILNTAVSGCVIGSTGFRIAGSDRMEMAMLAVGNVLIFCNFLQTLAPIKPIGVLVILIWRIAVHDVLICLALYMTLLCAFSGAQFVMYQRSDFVYSLEASGGMRLDTWPTTAMLRNIYVSMGEVNITGQATKLLPASRCLPLPTSDAAVGTEVSANTVNGLTLTLSGCFQTCC